MLTKHADKIIHTIGDGGLGDDGQHAGADAAEQRGHALCVNNLCQRVACIRVPAHLRAPM